MLRDEPTYCDCDDPGCEREHAPLSPADRALIDGKIAIQRMRLRAEGLSDPIRFALDTEVWGFVHDAYRLGIDAGELRGTDVTERRIVEWLRESYGDQVAANAIERGEHRRRARLRRGGYRDMTHDTKPNTTRCYCREGGGGFHDRGPGCVGTLTVPEPSTEERLKDDGAKPCHVCGRMVCGHEILRLRGMLREALEWDTTTCKRCGKPAKGHAAIGGARYCHEGPSPTCYEQASCAEALPPTCECKPTMDGRVVHYCDTNPDSTTNPAGEWGCNRCEAPEGGCDRRVHRAYYDGAADERARCIAVIEGWWAGPKQDVDDLIAALRQEADHE